MLSKRFIIPSLLVAIVGATAPAFADVKIEQIVVNQSAPTPEGTNLRVNLYNDGGAVETPRMVELQVREDADTPWRVVKVWELTDSQSRMMPGGRLALDYFPAPMQSMDSALEGDHYELKAIVNGASGPLTSFEHQHIVMEKR